MSRIGRDDLTSSYLDRPVLPELELRIRELLPFDPEAVTVVGYWQPGAIGATCSFHWPDNR